MGLERIERVVGEDPEEQGPARDGSPPLRHEDQEIGDRDERRHGRRVERVHRPAQVPGEDSCRGPGDEVGQDRSREKMRQGPRPASRGEIRRRHVKETVRHSSPPGTISHPDERDDRSRDGGHGVTAYFNRQITGATEIDLVIARVEKGIEPLVTVPRVTILDARKHTGRLTVSAERGVRLMIEKHHGVDVKKASEEGIRQPGVLVFDRSDETPQHVPWSEVVEVRLDP